MKHIPRECNCDNECCNICRGGLVSCTVCGGAEGSLPTDCPGTRMISELADDVYDGIIDFRENRGWIEPDGTGSSMGDESVLRTKRAIALGLSS